MSRLSRAVKGADKQKSVSSADTSPAVDSAHARRQKLKHIRFAKLVLQIRPEGYKYSVFHGSLLV